MDINTILEALRKAADLLKDRNTYYAIVIAIMCYLIWQKDQTITELKTENKIAVAGVEKEKELIQQRLDSKDCAQEVRAYKELIDGLQSTTASKAEELTKSLELERRKTEELENTYKLLNAK